MIDIKKLPLHSLKSHEYKLQSRIKYFIESRKKLASNLAVVKNEIANRNRLKVKKQLETKKERITRIEMLLARYCAFCGESLNSPNPNKLFCSINCTNKARRRVFD